MIEWGISHKYHNL